MPGSRISAGMCWHLGSRLSTPRNYSAIVDRAASGAMLIRVREGAARASDGCLTHRSDLAGVNQIYPVGLDTWGDRSGVVEAYADEFGGGFPEIRFTGNVAGCDAGTTSQAFRSAVMGRVNWYRAMAGLNPVSENQTYSDSAQQAALMMDAENDLSHTPGPDWACYSASGATAAGSSNLSLGYHAPNAIDGQMRDPGSNNRPVGHRRMILHPPSREMGTGDVPNAHALWVFDDHIWETDADIRSVRNFVRLATFRLRASPVRMGPLVLLAGRG